MFNLVWMQTGACSGETMALLCADRPSLENLLRQYDINLLWHPSLTAERRFGDVLTQLSSGEQTLATARTTVAAAPPCAPAQRIKALPPKEMPTPSSARCGQRCRRRRRSFRHPAPAMTRDRRIP